MDLRKSLALAIAVSGCSAPAFAGDWSGPYGGITGGGGWGEQGQHGGILMPPTGSNSSSSSSSSSGGIGGQSVGSGGDGGVTVNTGSGPTTSGSSSSSSIGGQSVGSGGDGGVTINTGNGPTASGTNGNGIVAQSIGGGTGGWITTSGNSLTVVLLSPSVRSPSAATAIISFRVALSAVRSAIIGSPTHSSTVSKATDRGPISPAAGIAVFQAAARAIPAAAGSMLWRLFGDVSVSIWVRPVGLSSVTALCFLPRAVSQLAM